MIDKLLIILSFLFIAGFAVGYLFVDIDNRTPKPEGKAVYVPSGKLKIEVLNGAGINGLAARFRDRLWELGYDVVRVDNAELPCYTETIFLLRTKPTPEQSKLLSILAPRRNAVLLQRGEHNCDVTIIVGKDYERYLGKKQD